ncbi:hypothetical protein AVEN_205653-1, partial [Araneus ventricosus]
LIKTECEVDETEHFRHHLHFVFNRGVKTTVTTLEIYTVNDEAEMPHEVVEPT